MILSTSFSHHLDINILKKNIGSLRYITWIFFLKYLEYPVQNLLFYPSKNESRRTSNSNNKRINTCYAKQLPKNNAIIYKIPHPKEMKTSSFFQIAIACQHPHYSLSLSSLNQKRKEIGHTETIKSHGRKTKTNPTNKPTNQHACTIEEKICYVENLPINKKNYVNKNCRLSRSICWHTFPLSR